VGDPLRRTTASRKKTASLVKVITDAGGIIPASRLTPVPRTWQVIRRKIPRVWTNYATGWLNTLRWARVLPVACGDYRRAMVFPAGLHRGQRGRHGLAMPRCARKPDWSPSLSRKCSWTASIRWSGASEVRRSPANGFHQLLHPTGDAGRHDPEAQQCASGIACPKQKNGGRVADATVKCLLRCCPGAIPGMRFLSGGQSGELASARLNP